MTEMAAPSLLNALIGTDATQSEERFEMAERIQFAFMALQNVQELNARADSKAYLVMTANGFLITFLGWMVTAVQSVWRHPLSVGVALHIVATFALILTVALSLYYAFRVIAPRLSSLTGVGRVQRSELLFFHDIVNTHANDQDYAQALLRATPEELLINISSSIYGASLSAREKYRAANRSIATLVPVLLAWIAFVALTFALN